MLTNYNSDSNIKDLTDGQIYAAIRYLEPGSKKSDEQTDDKDVLICVSLYIVLIGCVALWLYWR
jgi:hypothetical protein